MVSSSLNIGAITSTSRLRSRLKSQNFFVPQIPFATDW